MGRFSWGIGATSREARGGISCRTEELVTVEGERVGEGKVKEEVPSSYIRAPKYMWLLGLGLTALFGCWMEAAPVRSSNAMWTNHLFSEYRPPRRVHMNLIHSRKSALSLNATEPARLWNPPSDNGWKPCLTPDYKSEAAAGEDNGYLQVMCTGGLFQLHICVSNVVAVAKLLNVTMVIPYFRESIVWKDSSQFHDIYDIKHFIAYFKDDVRIVRHLPLQYAWSLPEYYQYQCVERSNCLAFIPKHSTMGWYLANVPPILGRHGLAVIDGFDHKLTFEGLPSHITKLRCRANFEGLRFVPAIQELGKRLVHRMKAKGLLHQSYIPVASEGTAKFPQQSAHRPWWSADGHLDGKRSSGSTYEKGGRYLGLHVRFQKDMIAHSACYYGGGRAEKRAVAAFRTYVWRNRVTKTKYKPEALRMNGSCPLTPEEIGLLLSGLGFTNNTPAYMAMKDLYGGQARLKPLKEMFPLLESKYTLATKKELKPFLPFAHKLAALDFIVSLNSDVFMSNAAGNFPNVLSGQRTFFGPRKSIHADKALLASLFANTSMSWSEFSRRVIIGHESRLGAPTHRLPKYSMYRYPAPDCMCRDSTAAR